MTYLEHADADDFDGVVVDVVEDGRVAPQFLSVLVERRTALDQRVDLRVRLGRDEVVIATHHERRVLHRLTNLAPYQIHNLTNTHTHTTTTTTMTP